MRCLQTLQEQAKTRDGSYTNGLAAQTAYIGGLEGRLRELKARIVRLDLELFYLYGRITQNEGISAEQLISEIETALANVEDRDETK